MRDVEIPAWLKGLPQAPVFRPTDTEFADPIAYISKIEKEASAFGICKIIPPLPKPSKKYVVSNLNKSLSKCPELCSDLHSVDFRKSPKEGCVDKGKDGPVQAVFTTRQQELGQNVKRSRGSAHPQPSSIHKQVWQSGEVYTFEQFESKSKAFTRNTLGMIKEVSPLVVETLFWKAASDKPIYVEYANDVPGSAFGEPEGQFRYFNKRRRKRMFNRHSPVKIDIKKYGMDTVTNSQQNRNKDVLTSTENKLNPSLEPSKPPTDSSDLLSDETSQLSRQVCSHGTNEIEGTAGWKLSNSPWNLQIISRSAGSLTRFMPDDIPGVTSPMVYIGMLFSWFAWHIEDHELHSLNFLHTGSPKTWYAVAGEYASAFEEVIRTHVYGGNLDCLAALTLLGEKTTLLSPEVVVASGIPCCRLVQNPGEFVVTFPRAYHVGFSHGFNCGEAANFGTPQWLKVAKEAAVRRAAMSYLPMLSHQQLLYLLTMSFISRVPRSLLPGARSSRLRDRQKEERELLVKRAFIEDMLNENNFASLLLGKQTAYRAVLWDPDLLPSPGRESQLCSEIAPAAPSPSEDDLVVQSEVNQNNLIEEMKLYLENVNGLYVDDDDLSCDLQVDSGTLACVACGVLGFPLMCILQPSERASMEFLHSNPLSVQEGDSVSKPLISCSPEINGRILGSVSGEVDDQDESQRDTEYSACKIVKDSEMSSTNANNFILGANDNMEINENNSPCHPIGSSASELNESALCHPENPPVPIPSIPSENLSKAIFIKLAEGWSSSSGFLRPRIFCLEHAFQIEELFQSKGGANVLVICHSDYQKIKAHAEVIAEEIGMHFDYNEIPLESASQEDLNLINLAIDGEEHNQCGEDWTSKFDINLQHCVKVRKNSPSEQIKHALKLRGLFCETIPSLNFVNFKWRSSRSRSKRKPNHNLHLEPCKGIQKNKFDVLGEKIKTKQEDKIIQYSRRRIKSGKGGNAKAPATQNPRSGLLEEIPSANCADSGLCATATLPLMEENSSVAALKSSEVRQEIVDAEESGDKLESSHTRNCVSSVAIDIPNVDKFDMQMEDQKEVIKMENLEALDQHDAHTNGDVVINHEICDSTSDPEAHQEIQAKTTNVLESDLSFINPVNQSTPVPMEDMAEVCKETSAVEDMVSGDALCSSQDNREPENILSEAHARSTARKNCRRRREAQLLTENILSGNSYIRSPCEGLRPRTKQDVMVEDKPSAKKVRKSSDSLVPIKDTKERVEEPHICDLEGCRMSFKTKGELLMHKRNRCPFQGCGKRFSSHKYAVLHQRVHDDKRPLKCPWKGCNMSFKWAWARTEHVRVHTGERPYHCEVEGCGLTFRYVSDYSRHRRKTGHYVNSTS